MYHPSRSTDAEYVELLNISDEAVVLYDTDAGAPWRLAADSGIEFHFPTAAPVVMAPGECIIVAKDLIAFSAADAVPPGTQVFEWRAGELPDDGGKVQLSAPGQEDADGDRYWIGIDGVAYSDGSQPQRFPTGVDPWPVQADGRGSSLSRIDATSYGNDPANWRGVAPSPGSIN
jgi:hypothetical protein